MRKIHVVVEFVDGYDDFFCQIEDMFPRGGTGRGGFHADQSKGRRNATTRFSSA